MIKYTTTSQLKKIKNFIEVKHYNRLDSIMSKKGIFYGWARKKSGYKAIKLAKKKKGSFILLEDGFIRSIGLGIDNSPSFSLVEDEFLGIN